MKAEIMLSTGEVFDIMHPHRHTFDITAIAGALSKLCRFAGQSKRFYSVAEHSVLVSRLLDEGLDRQNDELVLAGLLHDAAEAFIGDMVTPLKMTQPEFQEIEATLLRQIFKQFNLPPRLTRSRLVYHADKLALAIEARELMPAHDTYWNFLPPVEPKPWNLGWSYGVAREEFLRTFRELNERG